jgi:hypothetical protein
VRGVGWGGGGVGGWGGVKAHLTQCSRFYRATPLTLLSHSMTPSRPSFIVQVTDVNQCLSTAVSDSNTLLLLLLDCQELGGT